MAVTSKIVDNDPDVGPDIEGVDRHFYERQVPTNDARFDLAGAYFTNNSFLLAAARAKDKARHELIKAIQKADADARAASFTGFGNDRLLDQLSVSRTIDGRDGAPLNDIKL